MSSFNQNIDPNAAYQQADRQAAGNANTGSTDAYETGYQEGRYGNTDLNTGGTGGYSGADIDPRQHDQTSTGAYTGTQAQPAATAQGGGSGTYGGGQNYGTQTSTWDDTQDRGTAGLNTASGTDQPQATAEGETHRPSAAEKFKGNLEKVAGKLTGDPSKVAHGENLAHGRNL